MREQASAFSSAIFKSYNIQPKCIKNIKFVLRFLFVNDKKPHIIGNAPVLPFMTKITEIIPRKSPYDNLKV